MNYAAMEFTSLRIANLLLPHTFPTKPMKEGKLDAKVVPAYLEFDRSERYPGTLQQERPLHQSLSGGGVSVSLNYTFKNTSWGQFGMGFLGVYFRLTGEKLGFIAQNAGLTDIAFSGRQVSKGGIVAVTGNWDPIPGPSWFHLPLVLGFSFQTLRDEARAEGFVAGTYAPPGLVGGTFRSTNAIKFDSPGVLVGLSPQFRTGKWVRLSPFAMVSNPLKRAHVQNRFENLDTGMSFKPFDASFMKPVTAVGINATYIPWEIGFTYVPPFKMTNGATGYSVSLSKSFGGKTSR